MSVKYWLLSWFLVYPSKAPELDFWPKPDRRGSTLIWVRPNNTLMWEKSLASFLDTYESSKNYDVTQDCSYGNQPKPGRTCDFDITERFYPCRAEDGFGYRLGHPCVYLKMNLNQGYKPRFYNSSILPMNMPESVKTRIRNAERIGKIEELVWLSCEGEYAADKENIGPLMYLPDMGYHAKYFPDQKIDDYVSPLVAVYFEKPRVGVLINVVCKLWAPNLEYDEDENLGIIRFSIMIDT